MTAGMDDAVHVQVEVVKLHFIRIGLSGIDWNGLAAHHHPLQRKGIHRLTQLPLG